MELEVAGDTLQRKVGLLYFLSGFFDHVVVVVAYAAPVFVNFLFVRLTVESWIKVVHVTQGNVKVVTHLLFWLNQIIITLHKQALIIILTVNLTKHDEDNQNYK